jgi:putative cardiolipin synthase
MRECSSCRAGRLGWARCLVLASALLLAGCSGLPPLPERVASTHLGGTDDTALGRAVRAADPRDGRSGLRALSDPMEAFAARMLLVRTAQRSLDLQYYIWRPDVTGTFLLEALRRAADRGVRVRLLLDDNGIAGLDPLLADLDAHDRIEVRLFNPYPHRGFKALGYLTEFGRLNRRMHNKALIADTQAAIVGGRNIGDAYFGADPLLDFNDLDVLAAGPVAVEVAEGFDAYWNSALAYPVSALVDDAPQDAGALARRIGEVGTDPDAARYRRALRDTPLAQELTAGTLALEWVPMQLVRDPPEKAEAQAAPSQWMAADLTAALGRARKEVDLVSPYFVPGKGGTAMLARYPASGVRLRVVTNSLAATDVAAVHAGYARRRVDLLRAGVRLYELKPDPAASEAPRWRLVGSSAASLHGKTFALDRQRAYVGSFNIDPRSIRLNTEMGLVIDSPALATTISATLDEWLPANAYELRLGEEDRLEWVERTDAGEVVHREEPRASLWRRLLVAFLSLLPIDWLL